MMSKEAPPDFNKRFDVVGCFVMHEGKFLLLHRHPHKANGDTWGLPAGKTESGESFESAMVRELREETGIAMTPDRLQLFGSYFVRHRDFDFCWHMFSAEMTAEVGVRISPHEHSAFRWVTRDEASELPLIYDLDVCLDEFFGKSG